MALEANEKAVEEAHQAIPSPKGLPLIGNLFDIQNDVPIYGLERIIDLCGPIARFSILGKETVMIGSVALLEELSDDKRFWKTPAKSLTNGVQGPRGLFSADSEDTQDWQLAHRILMPSFGPLAIEGMFDEMYDIAVQLALKFARLGPSYRIPAASDFTRLTLDTIALCAMDFRFNSFYQDELHPFVKAMNHSLKVRSDSGKISSMIQRMMPWDRTAEEVKADTQYMRQVGQELVAARRENPTGKHDLLNSMINGKDGKTGEQMSDGLISANMVSFLVAGHETTSGLLSFAFLLLLQHPQYYLKVQEEIDRVVGKERINIKHLEHLHFCDAVFRETLRLYPTAPAFLRSIRSNNPNNAEFLADGKYSIRRADAVVCLIGRIHRDPTVYGEDADEFKPERMLEDRFKELPPSAWKPFGTGVRSCIGRAFAWQEAKICMALLFQNFNFRLDDPSYQLRVQQNLTIKPLDFFMRATLREGLTSIGLQSTLFSAATANGSHSTEEAAVQNGTSSPMSIFYGGNAGTCQALAQRLATEAGRHGFRATTAAMDDGVQALPKDQPVVVITASYEGEPPDNARRFVSWLRTEDVPLDLSGVRFAVFGCGHSDWVNSFQKIPTMCDDLLAKHGGTRIASRGQANAAQGAVLDDFEDWTKRTFWPALSDSTDDKSSASTAALGLDIEFQTRDRADILQQPNFHKATVIESRALTAPGEPEKRHMELRLPEDITYTLGDYLTVLPMQPSEQVQRVLQHFHISSNATIKIQPGAATFLPTNEPLSVADILHGYVELGNPATKSEIQTCADLTPNVTDQAELRKHVAAGNDARVSLLDLITHFPSIDMPFSTFLAMLPPLRPRFYTISSSPSLDSHTCTLTYGVLHEPSAWEQSHIGVTGNFLAHLPLKAELSVSVRNTNRFFRPPRDAETTPVIMLCAGTGLAPFRAFVQERQAQLLAGRTLAPALLFVGCRSETKDRLYAEEMDGWQKAGAVDVRYAFSREAEKSEGCKYVQDRLWKDREEVSTLVRGGAKVYVCGSPAVAAELDTVAMKILRDGLEERGRKMSEEEAKAWFRERRNERFVVDTFA